jgi:hypothetical protein
VQRKTRIVCRLKDGFLGAAQLLPELPPRAYVRSLDSRQQRPAFWRASVIDVAERQAAVVLPFPIADGAFVRLSRLAQPRRAFDEQAPDALAVLVLSRRKKNPSTISRSRSWPPGADRPVLGSGGNPSNGTLARAPSSTTIGAVRSGVAEAVEPGAFRVIGPKNST